MTNPVRAHSTPAGERYYVGLDPKERFMSVTTALSVLPKDWMGPWVAKMISEVACEIIDEILHEEYDTISGYFDSEEAEYDVDLLLSDMKKLPASVRDTAGALGDEVHARIEAENRGEEYSGECSEEGTKRVKVYKDLIDSMEIEVIESEFTIYNDTHGYAGSCDLYIKHKDTYYFADIKTSKNLSETFPLQVAAYANGDYIVRDDGSKEPMPEGYQTALGAVIWVTDTGCKFVPIDTGEEAFACFLAALFLKRNWVEHLLKETTKKMKESAK